MRRPPWPYLLALVIVLSSCAKGPDTPATDPFLAAEGQVRGDGMVYALASVTVPDGPPDPIVVADMFSLMIQRKLNGKGYSVVEPEVYDAWQELSDEVGSFTDPETGERDEGKLSRAMVEVLRRLGAGFDAGAILIPSIEVVEAPYQSGRAYWHGTSQPVKAGGVLTNFMAGSPGGKVPALSLRIAVYSPDGRKLYSHTGGIEVLRKIDGKDSVLVPRQELFKDTDRNRKAVDIAIDPLID